MNSLLFIQPSFDDESHPSRAGHAPATEIARETAAFDAYRDAGNFDIDPPEVPERKAPFCSGERGRDNSMSSLCVGASPMLPVIEKQLDGAHLAPHFYIQTCGHTPTTKDHGERVNVCSADAPICREIVALIAVDNGWISEAGKTELEGIAAGLDVSLYLVSYDATDHTSESIILRDGARAASSLRGLRLALSEDQHAHEMFAHPECETRGSKQSLARVSGWTEPLEKTLRKVRGARHVTVHGAIICEGCDALAAITDVRPVSEPYRRNRISPILSVARSANAPLVTIEHLDYHPAERPMNILVHSEVHDDADVYERGTLFDAAGALYDALDAHQCNVGGTWEN